jgi:hypothetical protein
MRDTALDDAVLFHFLDTTPARRRGKADLLGQIGNGQS